MGFSMNLTKILRKLKGKRLDEVHYELLHQAAEFQAEKLALIQAANKTLLQNNDLLKDKVRSLEHEIRRMRGYSETPQGAAAISSGGSFSQHVQEISDITVAILRECIRQDLDEFDGAQMAGYLSCKIGEVETALAELLESGLIAQERTGSGEALCRLTAAGKSYARTLSPENHF